MYLSPKSQTKKKKKKCYQPSSAPEPAATVKFICVLTVRNQVFCWCL